MVFGLPDFGLHDDLEGALYALALDGELRRRADVAIDHQVVHHLAQQTCGLQTVDCEQDVADTEAR